MDLVPVIYGVTGTRLQSLYDPATAVFWIIMLTFPFILIIEWLLSRTFYREVPAAQYVFNYASRVILFILWLYLSIGFLIVFAMASGG